MRRDDGYYVHRPRGRRVQVVRLPAGSFELESVLIEHPAIAEAAVVPAGPRAAVGAEDLHHAAAGLRGGLALDIFRFSREKLAPYKRIRRLQFAELPKTISGKIRRVELRRRGSSVVTMPVNGCPANTGKRISPPN